MKVVDPVLLCNELGVDPAGTDGQDVPRTGLSVKEAVQIAKDNNFMGLICNHELMVCFHSFIPSFLPSFHTSIQHFSSHKSLFQHLSPPHPHHPTKEN